MEATQSVTQDDTDKQQKVMANNLKMKTWESMMTLYRSYDVVVNVV